MSIESARTPEALWRPDTEPPTSDTIKEIESRTADLLPFIGDVSYDSHGQLTYEREDQNRMPGVPLDITIQTVDGDTIRKMVFKIPYPTTNRIIKRGAVTLVDTSDPNVAGWNIHFKGCGNSPSRFLGLLTQGVRASDESISQLGFLAGFMPRTAPARAVDHYGFTVETPEYFEQIWGSANNDLARRGISATYSYDHVFPFSDGDVHVAVNECADNNNQLLDRPSDKSIVVTKEGAFHFKRGIQAGIRLGYFEERSTSDEMPPLTEEDRRVHPYRIEKLGEDSRGQAHKVLKWDGGDWEIIHIHEGTAEDAQAIADEQYQIDLYKHNRSGQLTQARAQRVLQVLDRVFSTEMLRLLLATD